MLIPRPLPGDMNINITKAGNEPAKIVVNRGNEKWEVTEKELDKLPADVRPYVEQMLGRGMVGIVGGAVPPGMSAGFFLLRPARCSAARSRCPPSSGNGQTQPFPGGLDPRLEKWFDEMNRRMDQLLKMMQERSQGHAQPVAPETSRRRE